jgi:hypothetical protein
MESSGRSGIDISRDSYSNMAVAKKRGEEKPNFRTIFYFRFLCMGICLW